MCAMFSAGYVVPHLLAHFFNLCTAEALHFDLLCGKDSKMDKRRKVGRGFDILERPSALCDPKTKTPFSVKALEA